MKETPSVILVIAGAVNGLILPITLSGHVGRVYKTKIDRQLQTPIMDAASGMDRCCRNELDGLDNHPGESIKILK